MEITNKYEKAIMRYESARVSVIDLERQRADLLSSCDMLRDKDDLKDYAYVRITSKTCLEEAFDYLLNINDPDSQSCEMYTYKTALDMHGCCDNCRGSYEIKKGSLAKARQEFGESKRALIRMGKKLIKSERE